MVNPPDGTASSQTLGWTGKTVWTTQTGLRSRWRRSESCRGRQFLTRRSWSRLSGLLTQRLLYMKIRVSVWKDPAEGCQMLGERRRAR